TCRRPNTPRWRCSTRPMPVTPRASPCTDGPSNCGPTPRATSPISSRTSSPSRPGCSWGWPRTISTPGTRVSEAGPGGQMSGGYGGAVNTRSCSRPSCRRPAVSTLTYVYADSTAVLGPLATFAEPHSYDLCEEHSQRLTAPRGWDLVRLEPYPSALEPSQDALQALADAVRSAARPASSPAPAPEESGQVTVGGKGHLRVLRPIE